MEVSGFDASTGSMFGLFAFNQAINGSVTINQKVQPIDKVGKVALSRPRYFCGPTDA